MSYSQRAEVYDVEYVEDRDRAFVLSLVAETGGRVLEIPCGAGRLSRWLAEAAEELTVVDLEPKMVERAVASARAKRRARVVGEVADMRALRLGRSFDLALIPREALQLLRPADAAQSLAAVAAHVAPGGLMFVDLATFPRERRSPPDPDYYHGAAIDGVWREDWTRKLADGSTLIRRSAQVDETDSIVFELEYRRGRNEAEAAPWRSRMRLYRYDPAWLRAATPPNMRLAALYGGYDRTAFSILAPRLLALYRVAA